MKPFTLLILLSFIITYLGIPVYCSVNGRSFITTKNHLQTGHDLGNRNSFLSRNICESSWPYVNKTLFSYTPGLYGLDEPSVFADTMIFTNRDCHIRGMNFDDGTMYFDFPLSDYGGRPCSTNGDDSVLLFEDWSRNTPALIGQYGTPFGIDTAVVCNTAIGVGSATCYHFDPTYRLGGTPPLLGSIVIDSDIGAIITPSVKTFFYFRRVKVEGKYVNVGVKVCLAAASSRTEFWKVFPVLAPPTFVGGLYAYNCDTMEPLWNFRTAPLDEGYSGAAIVATPTVSLLNQKIFIVTQNNYNVPQHVKDCLIVNQTCSDIDHPDNRPDSIIALDLDGNLEWSVEHSGSLSPDTWDISCALGPCDPYTGDDGGSITPPIVTQCYDESVQDMVQCVVAGYKRGDIWVHAVEDGRLIKRFIAGPGSALGGGSTLGVSHSILKNRIIFTNHNGSGKPWTLVDGTNTTGPFITVLDMNSMTIWAQKPTMGSCFGGASLLNERWIVCSNRKMNYFSVSSMLFLVSMS
jgi:outer membrane protein assembly factor BamB